GVTEGDNGVGVVECNTDHGLAAVVVDTKTLSTRSFPINYRALTVDGDELVDMSKDALELRALGSGALLPFSSRGPRDLRYDAFWEGATLVVGLDTGPGALVPRATRPTVHRISHLGATLQTVTEPASQAGPCAGPLSMRRGRFSWASKPPSTLCDRRSGRVLGDLPALPSTAWIDVSDDGELVINDGAGRRTLRHRSGPEVLLAEPPVFAQFAGAGLLVGYDATSGGVWNGADGKRIAHWNQTQALVAAAADAQLGILVTGHPHEPVRLLDLWSGQELEQLPVSPEWDVQFVTPGVLSVAEAAQVSFWHIPKAKRLGRWLAHPVSDESAFLADSGEFEVSGPVLGFRDALRCAVGNAELPLETCIDALFEPGIAARTLGL
ncbi:MAG: hypothetical protein ABI488_19555, partial [Polyangiaceae bacterium]